MANRIDCASFLPRVEKFEQVGDLCQKLSAKFHIPPFFWSKTAWDANGFFGARNNPIQDERLESHCTMQSYILRKNTLTKRRFLLPIFDQGKSTRTRRA
jgi:hypothetical protein